MRKRILPLFLLGLFSPLASWADLTLYIDATTNEFWFGGSVTLTPDLGTKGLSWGEGTGSGSVLESAYADIGSSFNATGNTFTSFELYLNQYNVSGTELSLIGWFSTTDSVTLTADSSVKFSFTDFDISLSTDLEQGFESYIGQTITLTAGSGDFSSLKVMDGSAVPEPASFAAVGGLAALALAFARGRRKKPHAG